MVSAINTICKETFAKVITDDVETDFFQIIPGILLGDTLALFLFVIALDRALRELMADTIQHA